MTIAPGEWVLGFPGGHAVRINVIDILIVPVEHRTTPLKMPVLSSYYCACQMHSSRCSAVAAVGVHQVVKLGGELVRPTVGPASLLPGPSPWEVCRQP